MSLSRRLFSSAVLIPLLAVFIIFTPPVFFTALVILVLLLSAREWFTMNGTSLNRRLPAVFLIVALPIGLHISGDRFWGIYMVMIMLTMSAASIAYKGSPQNRLALIKEMSFALLFIGAPLGFFVLIRKIPSGKGVILFLLIVLWIVDSAAYFAGTIFGNRPLAPVLSPKKTVEGLIAGLIAGFVGGAVASPLLVGTGPLTAGFIGVFLCLLGQLGDIFESLWKRSLGCKDSGNIIPGHGGILDRLDSFLLTAPALYYTFIFISGK